MSNNNAGIGFSGEYATFGVLSSSGKRTIGPRTVDALGLGVGRVVGAEVTVGLGLGLGLAVGEGVGVGATEIGDCAGGRASPTTI
jgi:hypothetical protein